MSRARELVSGRWLPIVLPMAVAVAVRLPSTVFENVRTFDDGVYLASVGAMRLGFEPFREIFSSQGPLFLPLLRLFDILGGELYWAPRVSMLVVGAALAGLSASLVTRWGSTRAEAWIAGLLIGASGSALLTVWGLQSEGPAIALGLAAFWLVSSPSFTRSRALTAGVLLGIAVSIKSIFVLPVGLAVAWLIVRRRRGGDLILAAFLGVVVVVLSVGWWGFSEVWDQYVVFHLDARVDRDLFGNIRVLAWRAWVFDKPALVLGVSSAAAAMFYRMRRGKWEVLPVVGADSQVRQFVVQSLVVWVVAAVAVLASTSPLFARHSVFLLIPAVLLVLMVLPIPRWVAGLTIGAVLLQLVIYGWVPAENPALAAEWLPSEDPIQTDAIKALETLPEDSFVVSDEPGIPYLAGLAIPPNLVDPSLVRIRAGHLSSDEVGTAIQDPDTCALLLWSGRLQLLGYSADNVEGYAITHEFGKDRVLLRRIERCPLG